MPKTTEDKITVAMMAVALVFVIIVLAYYEININNPEKYEPRKLGTEPQDYFVRRYTAGYKSIFRAYDQQSQYDKYILASTVTANLTDTGVKVVVKTPYSDPVIYNLKKTEIPGVYNGRVYFEDTRRLEDAEFTVLPDEKAILQHASYVYYLDMV